MPKEVADWFSHSSEMGRTPDVVYYFPEKIAKPYSERKSDSGKHDLFETAGSSFDERVHNAYEWLANELKFQRVYPLATPEITLENLLR